MLHRCAACEKLYEEFEEPESGRHVCPACRKAPVTSRGTGLATIRIRCPACGNPKTIPASLRGESLKCAECGVWYPAVQADASDAPEARVRREDSSETLSPSGLSLTGRDSPLWILRWALPLALLPLVWLTAFPPTPPDVRLEQMAEHDPALAESLDQMKEGDDIFARLPGQRLEGALLAKHSSAHWLMAGVAEFAAFFYLVLGWPPGRARPDVLFGIGLFTATIGILLLIGFQYVAVATQGVWIRGGGIGSIFFLLVKFIGYSYSCALDPRTGFWASLFGYTFGVGLCEELCKALPIAAHLRGSVRSLDWRGMVLWGLASGIGFGIAEGIMYSSDYYNGVEGATIYVVRFVSCVALHAAWNGINAIRFYRNPGPLQNIEDWYDWLPALVIPLLPSMALHGLYDTLLKRDHEAWALLVAAASFGVFLLAYEQWRREQLRAVHEAEA